MPRLKYTKLQGVLAFVCPHLPEWMFGPIDDFGRQRCCRCYHKVTVVLTRKGFDRAWNAMR